MKSLSIYIITIAAVSFLLIDREASAQSVEALEIVTPIEQADDCSNINQANIERPVIYAIVEEDYPYLKNLECLKNEDFQESLKKRGWNLHLNDVNPRDPSHFELSGSGPRINVHATYDADGNLVESMLRMEDIVIPIALREFIHSGEFEGWTMTGNEKVVKDFDPYQTEYNVTLSNGNKEKILSFKDQGNRLLFAGVIN